MKGKCPAHLWAMMNLAVQKYADVVYSPIDQECDPLTSNVCAASAKKGEGHIDLNNRIGRWRCDLGVGGQAKTRCR